MWAAIVGLATIFSVLAGIDYVWDRPWPSFPEIHPRDPLNGSSFILPFTIRNTSGFFPMTNVEMICGVDWVYFKDARGNKAVFTDAGFANRIYSIPIGETISYQCDASD